MSISILGCAPHYVPVLFDLINENTGQRVFDIYMNVAMDTLPQLASDHDYLFNIHSAESDIDIDARSFVLGVSTPPIKHKVYNFYKARIQNLSAQLLPFIHSKAYIATSAKIGNGCIIEPLSIVSSVTAIDFGTTLRRGVSIGHHNQVGRFCDINPGVVTSGLVTIGDNCIIGSGAIIRDKVHIGDNCIIGMGSVVTKDIPAGSIAYGNPCKIISTNTSWQYL